MCVVRSGVVKSEIMPDQELAEELHKPIIRKFEKCKICSSFNDNVWGADLVDMQLISKCNKGFFLFIMAINIYSKYAWVLPLKDKKGITIIIAFIRVLDESSHKPNKIWVDKDSKFCNRSIKRWLQDNDIEMNSTHNEGNSCCWKIY